MKPNAVARHRRPKSYTTPPQRRQWVQRYERSGLTQREFAQRHCLGQSTLSRWLRAVRQDHVLEFDQAAGAKLDQPLSFRELPLASVVGGTHWVAELCLPSGAVVRVGEKVSLEVLDTLLAGAVC